MTGPAVEPLPAATTPVPARLVVVVMATLTGSTSVVFALLSQLQDAYHLPTWGLGVMSGAAFVAGFVVQLIGAPYADRGHARSLMVAGLVLGIISNLALAGGSSLAVFAAARACTGAAYGLFAPAARALLAGDGDEHGVAARLGRLSAAEIVGFTLGPVVGVLMADGMGLRAPFLIFALGPAIALPVLVRRQFPPPATGVPMTPSLALLRDRRVQVGVLLAFVEFVPVGMYDALWSRYLADRGASTLFIGVSLTSFSVPFALLATTGGRFADRRGALRVALVALAGTLPLTVTYGIVRRPGLIVATAMVESVLQAFAIPAIQANLAHVAPPGQAAAAQGLGGAAGLLGAAALGLAAAPVYEVTTHWVVFATTAGLMAVLLALAASLSRRLGASDHVTV